MREPVSVYCASRADDANRAKELLDELSFDAETGVVLLNGVTVRVGRVGEYPAVVVETADVVLQCVADNGQRDEFWTNLSDGDLDEECGS